MYPGEDGRSVESVAITITIIATSKSLPKLKPNIIEKKAPASLTQIKIDKKLTIIKINGVHIFLKFFNISAAVIINFDFKLASLSFIFLTKRYKKFDINWP